MRRYGITGASSTIAKRFIELPAMDGIEPRDEVIQSFRSYSDLPLDLDRYLLCAGVLYGQKVAEMPTMGVLNTLAVNYVDVVVFLERLFENNKTAHVCVIGSMSGIAGSYDTMYAGSKAALHLYVQTKRLQKEQHLVCVAPTIIEDSGMTTRREDYAEVIERGKARRLGRWLTADEVARTAMFAIENDAMCNSVVELSGGNW